MTALVIGLAGIVFIVPWLIGLVTIAVVAATLDWLRHG